ncbi:MAG TPA: type I polyketide synthase, partial [Actinomycetota bacterium]|nr:type I polyketide synthase [Actinomycetota bacterium]
MTNATTPLPTPLEARDLILAVTPFERPDARVAAAAVRAGAVGVLDLGHDREEALAALRDTARWSPGPFGVRVPSGCPVLPADLPDAVDTVLLAAGAPWAPGDTGPKRRVLVEVTAPDDAPAPGCGVDGLVARGSESGGTIGELSTFVLLQRLLAASGPRLPVWAAGGIGLHTAAGAVAGGAAGVVLDAQLALTKEALEALPSDVAAALRAMDGSETAVVDGRRLYSRPGPQLTGGPLPIGQDGAFAATLAATYRTVGGIVQALRASIRTHMAAALATSPLAEGSGLARRGLRLPVAQGPMTRVSDRTAFAAAVAGGGGLPFLALALMGGSEVATLLAEAAEALAGKPW